MGRERGDEWWIKGRVQIFQGRIKEKEEKKSDEKDVQIALWRRQIQETAGLTGWLVGCALPLWLRSAAAGHLGTRRWVHAKARATLPLSSAPSLAAALGNTHPLATGSADQGEDYGAAVVFGGLCRRDAHWCRCWPRFAAFVRHFCFLTGHRI